MLSLNDYPEKLIEQLLDFFLYFCDVYLEEVEQRINVINIDLNGQDHNKIQKIQKQNEENLNAQKNENEQLQLYLIELKKFKCQVFETKQELIQVQNDQIEIQKGQNEQFQFIQQKLIYVNPEFFINIIQELKKNNFYVESFMGSGGEADILLGFEFIQNTKFQECVFRCLQLDTKDDYEKQQLEFDIAKSIQNPINVIKYYSAIYLDDLKIAIFAIEKCQFSLLAELKYYKGILNETQLCQIIFDLIEGLIQLRIHYIVHQDIKPANFFKTFNGYYVYSDFGLASIVVDQQIGIMSQGCTVKYSSPEQLKKQNVTHKTDIYSLGKTIVEIINIIIYESKCTYQTKLIGESFKQLATDNMIQKNPKDRVDCLKLLEKFQEQIFQEQYHDFLKVYLKKIEQIIASSNNLYEGDYFKSLKNFDYEYYNKVIYTYCILQIRISLCISRIQIDKKQLKKNILDNDFASHNVKNIQIAFSIQKAADYFRLQNKYYKALKFYQQALELYFLINLNSQIENILNRMFECFQQLSQLSEGLQYLLEQKMLCNSNFYKIQKIDEYLNSYIFKIVQKLIQNEDNELNMIQGLEYLMQNEKDYDGLITQIFYKLIKIFQAKNDLQNLLKYRIELFNYARKFNCFINLYVRLIHEIQDIHKQCNFDFPNFINGLIKQQLSDSNPDDEKLQFLHFNLGEYYLFNNIELSLKEIQKSINIKTIPHRQKNSIKFLFREYIHKEQNEQNILKLYECLQQNDEIDSTFRCLEKLIKIYKIKEDKQNQLKYTLELFDYKKQKNILKFTDPYEYYDILKLFQICNQDFTNFIHIQHKYLVEAQQNPIILYFFHISLGKYYLFNNIELFLQEFQKAIQIKKKYFGKNDNIDEERLLFNQYIEQEQKEQNLINLFEHLKQYQEVYLEQQIKCLQKLIHIYQVKDDKQNELKYSIELIFQMRKRSNYEELYSQINYTMQLHEICNLDYSNFVEEQLKQELSNQNPNDQLLIFLHADLGKSYFLKKEYQLSLQELKKASIIKQQKFNDNINVIQNKDSEVLFQKCEEISSYIQQCFFYLNDMEGYYLFLREQHALQTTHQK